MTAPPFSLPSLSLALARRLSHPSRSRLGISLPALPRWRRVKARCKYQSGGGWHPPSSLTDALFSSDAWNTFHDSSRISQDQDALYSYLEDCATGDDLGSQIVDDADDTSTVRCTSPVAGYHFTPNFEGPSVWIDVLDVSHESYIPSGDLPCIDEGYPAPMGTPGAGHPVIDLALLQPPPPPQDCPSFMEQGMDSFDFLSDWADTSAGQTLLSNHTPSSMLGYEQNLYAHNSDSAPHNHFVPFDSSEEDMAPAAMPSPSFTEFLSDFADTSANQTLAWNPTPSCYDQTPQNLDSVEIAIAAFYAQLDVVGEMATCSIPPPSSFMPSVANSRYHPYGQYSNGASGHGFPYVAGPSSTALAPQLHTGMNPQYADTPTSSVLTTPSSSYFTRSLHTTPATTPEPVDAALKFPATGPVRPRRHARGRGRAPRFRGPPAPPCALVGTLSSSQLTELVAEAQRDAEDLRGTVQCSWADCTQAVEVPSLLQHLRDMHHVGFNKTTVICQWDGGCGADAMSGGALRKHVLSQKHLDLYVTCPTCKHQFQRADALMRHLRETRA
ncbi:hypothetical protein B0H12DRAFT_220529 [Mycena haematopus]|nr:hypothetical protein B0H12DRAFT_220529 [Mycena haematopus]